MGNVAVVRVQFEMAKEKMADLDRLRVQTALRTRREVFDNALTFFEWGVTASINGHLVAAIDEQNGEYQPILMPVFAAAHRRAQAEGGKARPQRPPLKRI